MRFSGVRKISCSCATKLRMQIVSFKELIVWQRAVQLVKEIYDVTEKFPREELFILIAQMRRAALSISANIAEGKKRKTKKDFLQFLRIADGSAAEIETHVIVAKQLYHHIDFAKAESLLLEVQKMLTVFILRIRNLYSSHFFFLLLYYRGWTSKELTS